VAIVSDRCVKLYRLTLFILFCSFDVKLYNMMSILGCFFIYLFFLFQVADFGLARYSLDTETHVSTRVMGTFG
jgi:hypothetical protein